MENELISILPWNALSMSALTILLLPLLSFLAIVLLPKKYERQASWLGTSILLVSTLLSIWIMTAVGGGETTHSRFVWFSLSPADAIHVGIKIDIIAAAMLVVVCLVSFLVHLYSTQYMKGDAGYKRYFAFLGLFTFSMLGIVVSDSLFLIFIFWELVGLSSYLLIGHWYHKATASKAAQKAFIVNRIGDVGFIVGLAILWSQFKTFDLETLQQLMSQSTLEAGQWVSATGATLSAEWLTISGICLFMGAIGKSAQFPLQVWLPYAMEGPTPVSALIHAATMVAAGVFLVARIFPLLNIDALTVIAFVGAITAFMGAVAALTQHDIKKVLAYSTISQLGYMLMGMGVGAYDASLFHLLTHAFFKACLFLSAGSVIHGLHKYAHHNHLDFDHQDMRNMGGLRKSMPVTFLAYVVSALALVGVPLFSGFLSKDAILSGAYAWASLTGGGQPFHYLIPLLGFVSVILTALYMTRQILLVFFGELRISSNTNAQSSVQESPLVMKLPLLVLGVLSIGLVWSLNPFSATHSWVIEKIEIPLIASPGFSAAWQESLHTLSIDNHTLVSVISLSMIVIGSVYGYMKYNPKSTYSQNYADQAEVKSFTYGLSYNNWFLDKLYDRLIVKPTHILSVWLQNFEKNVIDRAVNWLGIGYVIVSNVVGWIDRGVVDGFVNFSVFFAGRIGVLTKSVQAGKVQSYIAVAILGLLIIIFWLI